MTISAGARRTLVTAAAVVFGLIVVRSSFPALVGMLLEQGIIGNAADLTGNLIERSIGLASLVLPLVLSASFLVWRKISIDFGASVARWRLVFAGFLMTAFPGLSLLAVAACIGVWNPAALSPPFGDVLNAFWVATVLLFAFIGVVTEELIFRGMLGAAVEQSMPQRFVAIALVSALFAFAHYQWDWGSLLARMLLGMALAWAAVRLSGIEYGIGAHYAVNVVALLTQAPFGVRSLVEPSIEGAARHGAAHFANWASGGLAYAILIVGGAEVLKRFEKRDRTKVLAQA